jgi:Domain of unknown function (DUF3482)
LDSLLRRVCGLNEKQLVVAASAAGAVLGLSVDAVLAFHSFGIFGLVGEGIGAGAAFITGKSRPKIEVKLPGKVGRILGYQKLSGRDIKVEPLKALF